MQFVQEGDAEVNGARTVTGAVGGAIVVHPGGELLLDGRQPWVAESRGREAEVGSLTGRGGRWVEPFS